MNDHQHVHRCDTWEDPDTCPIARAEHVEELRASLRPINSLSVAEHKVADVTELLLPYFALLRHQGTVPAEEIPSDAEVAEWTAGLFTDHGGRLRPRRQATKGASGAVRGVHGVYRWHAGGGALDGLFIAKWNAGEAYPRVETYVSVLRVASGRVSSPALDAWKRTGLVPA